jgi:4a-hydroxytetrahydrobiopterin dehydratase
MTQQELQAALGRLPGWDAEGEQIKKTYEFQTYLEGLDFAMALGREAERRDHHPDMKVTWRKVEVALSTHSEGGITEKDTGLAEFAESL